jgi:hypothetical protein
MKIDQHAASDLNNKENRRFTTFDESDFVTEDTGTGDATVPVILDRIASGMLAVILALGIIIIAHWIYAQCTGEW